MRREERHHLKENPLARALTRTQALLLDRGRALATAGIIVVVAAAAAGGYVLWQQQRASQAGELLADALIVLQSPIAQPPEAGDAEADAAVWEQPPGTYPDNPTRLEAALEVLQAVADAYPGLRAGVAARYEAAAVLVELDRLDAAAAAYTAVLDAADDPLHTSVARLGLAETRILDGDAAGAVELLQAASLEPEGTIPLDAILMRLGHAYELDGQGGAALDTFTRVIDEFPLSVYAAEARRKADLLDRDVNSN